MQFLWVVFIIQIWQQILVLTVSHMARVFHFLTSLMQPFTHRTTFQVILPLEPPRLSFHSEPSTTACKCIHTLIYVHTQTPIKDSRNLTRPNARRSWSIVPKVSAPGSHLLDSDSNLHPQVEQIKRKHLLVAIKRGKRGLEGVRMWRT